MIYFNKLKAFLKKTFIKPRPVQFKKYNTSGNDYTIAIHTGVGAVILSHVGMWLSSFQEAKIKFCIITRNKIAFNLSKKHFTHVPVYYAYTAKDLELLFNNLPQLERIFYTSNTGNNFHAFSFNKYTHILIGHGDSDKKASVYKLFKVYDEFWVAGQAAIDRFDYANINMSGVIFKTIASPFVYEQVLFASENPWHTREKKYNILYLPTWEGGYIEQSYSSLGLALDFLAELTVFNIQEINIKLHPATGIANPTFKNYNKQILKALKPTNIALKFYSKDTELRHILPKHSLFICDCSATLMQCLAMDYPLFVYLSKYEDIAMAQTDYAIEDYAYTFSSVEEFREIFQRFMDEGDYLADIRHKVRNYYIDIEAVKEKAFIKALQKA